MSIANDIISPLKSLVDKAESIFVLLPQNAGTEHVAAGLGIYHVLNSAGKNVTIASPTKLSQTAHALPGANHVTDKVGNRNLVISLQVENRDSIDKVSYNLDEESKVFNLIIQPKKGHAPLKEADVEFTYSGAQADLLFIIGANRLEDLNPFYESERSLFSDAKMVAINRFSAGAFADFHVTDQSLSGNSELTFQLIKSLDLSLTAEASTALLSGIDQATNRLQTPTLKAETFEAVASLMRAGGVRGQNVPNPMPTPQNQPAPAPINNTILAPVDPVIATQIPAIPTEEIPQGEQGTGSSDVPDEWLQPKIFKGVPGQSK